MSLFAAHVVTITMLLQLAPDVISRHCLPLWQGMWRRSLATDPAFKPRNCGDHLQFRAGEAVAVAAGCRGKGVINGTYIHTYTYMYSAWQVGCVLGRWLVATGVVLVLDTYVIVSHVRLFFLCLSGDRNHHSHHHHHLWGEQ